MFNQPEAITGCVEVLLTAVEQAELGRALEAAENLKVNIEKRFPNITLVPDFKDFLVQLSPETRQALTELVDNHSDHLAFTLALDELSHQLIATSPLDVETVFSSNHPNYFLAFEAEMNADKRDVKTIMQAAHQQFLVLWQTGNISSIVSGFAKMGFIQRSLARASFLADFNQQADNEA